MKYYLIAGEASGDLHASNLMAALREKDPKAEFRFFGGDKMQAQGGELVNHYKHLAYMGFLPVLLHARTILRGMKQCKQDIVEWKPDALILVDYPGFNLRIAKYVKSHTDIPIFYYISPKIWAWKERRIHAIRKNIDLLLGILPFEVDYFWKKHQYKIEYVGNPTRDEVSAYLEEKEAHFDEFVSENGLSGKPLIALLAGSRKQEINDNLPRMLKAVEPYISSYDIVLAAAPGIEDALYAPYEGVSNVKILKGRTFEILRYSTLALVTSGTATLETALFHVPQVVCYYLKAGRLASWGKKLLLKVPYISLVNLIADQEVVPELIADGMTVRNLQSHIQQLLPGGEARQKQLEGYQLMEEKLGQPGAPAHTAARILAFLTAK